MDFFVSRQRPALGECLASLAAAIPVAFLEPTLNRYNPPPSSTPKPPGRGLVSTIHQRSSLMYLEESSGRESQKDKDKAALNPVGSCGLRGAGGQNWCPVREVSILLETELTSKFFVFFRLWLSFCEKRRWCSWFPGHPLNPKSSGSPVCPDLHSLPAPGDVIKPLFLSRE